MDKELDALTRLDWSDLDHVRIVAEQSLQKITRPGAISELLVNATRDARLLDLSEVPYWGDRIVLFDHPSSGVRVRLHRFNELFDHPHSHRWGFSTRVLRGGYKQWLYGPESWFQQATEQGRAIPRPGLVRYEGVGTSYTIDHSMVHNVKVAAGTISVIVRGPVMKDRAIRVKREASQVTWQVGRDQESQAEVASKRASSDNILELLEDAKNFGVAAH